MIVDVPVPAVYRQRLLDPRGRDVARRRCRRSSSRRRPCGRTTPLANPRRRARSSPEAELYQALVLGTRDYCTKNGFTDVVIGLSGGIDSTLVAVIAVDALGADHVHGVSMPSRVLERPLEVGRRAARRRTSASTTARSRSSRRSPPTSRCWRRASTAAPPGLTAGEHPEPLPRPAADGAVQRVRLDGADDRQQERDGRRLLHDLRRLRRRVRGDQGRAQDRGVRAVPLRQPSGPVGS